MLVARHAYHGHQRHFRVCHHNFNLTRIHVKSAANNHIFHTVHDIKEAVFVLLAHIARMEPATPHAFFRGLRAFVIALHHIVPANTNLAFFTHRQFIHILIHHHQLDPPNGDTN